jgi:hypothetical protein
MADVDQADITACARILGDVSDSEVQSASCYLRVQLAATLLKRLDKSKIHEEAELMELVKGWKSSLFENIRNSAGS